MRSRRRGNEDGAAAVEFALVVQILAMLLIGVVTFGLAYSGKIALANAVREGARAGSAMPVNPNWGTSVTQRVKDVFAEADQVGLKVCAALYKNATVVQSDDPGCGTAPPTPSGIAAGTCYVKVWAEKPTSLNWVLGSSDITLGAQSVSVYNRNAAC